MFSNQVLLDSGRAMVSRLMTWPLKRYWGGLTLFSLPLIAHAVHTGMHHHWKAAKLPNSCSGKRVCTRVVYAEALISVWKVCNSKRYCETRFTNAITKKIAVWKHSLLKGVIAILVFSRFGQVIYRSYMYIGNCKYRKSTSIRRFEQCNQ